MRVTAKKLEARVSEQIAAEKPTIIITGIKIESDPIDVSGSEVDPDWLFVDAAGNEHRWQKDADDTWGLPTLEMFVTHDQTWDEFSETWRPCKNVEYFAPATGESVDPGIRYMKRFIQGLIEASVEFESNAIPPERSVRFDECVFPMQYDKVVKDLGSWTFFVKEWKKIGPEKWSGVGACVGAPPGAKGATR